jgi:hypothetical protein
MALSLMNTDKNGIGINEVKLDVPAIALDHVNLDACGLMMGGGGMILPLAITQHGANLLRADSAHLQQVLGVDVVACLMLIGPIFQGSDDLLFCFFESDLCHYTILLVKKSSMKNGWAICPEGIEFTGKFYRRFEMIIIGK